MYYYLSYAIDENNTRIKVWQIVQQKQKGWCRLAFTHTIDNGQINPRQNVDPNETYSGRVVNIVTTDGIPLQTVKIYGPMGGDEWQYMDFAQTLEAII
jgi:hypothetical protein